MAIEESVDGDYMASDAFTEDQDWLQKLMVSERERRAKVGAFAEKLSAFANVLDAHIRAKGTEYEKDFPDEKVIVNYDSDQAQFTVLCQRYEVQSPRAIVRIEASNQRITCKFDYAGDHRGWEERLEVSELGLHNVEADQDSTARQLAKRILIPILFPKL